MHKRLPFISLIIIIAIWSLFSVVKPEVGNVLADDQGGQCEGTADLILRSTVRMHLQAWRMAEDESGFLLDESIGHATLQEENILVTHNHYEFMHEPHLTVSVAFYASDGRFLFSAPLRDFEVILAGPETLHFRMKHDFISEKLAEAGIVPAQFAKGRSLKIAAGSTVGQVDWDGSRTRVDCVTVEQVILDQGVPRLVVDDGVTLGASGGGLFFNGLHVANNWQTIEVLDPAGNWFGMRSVGALN